MRSVMTVVVVVVVATKHARSRVLGVGGSCMEHLHIENCKKTCLFFTSAHWLLALQTTHFYQSSLLVTGKYQ